MASEFVVIQVRNDKTDGAWMDYSRCTAGEALGFMASARASRTDAGWRAVHWIDKDELSTDQLRVMVGDPEQYAYRAPKSE